MSAAEVETVEHWDSRTRGAAEVPHFCELMRKR